MQKGLKACLIRFSRPQISLCHLSCGPTFTLRALRSTSTPQGPQVIWPSLLISIYFLVSWPWARKVGRLKKKLLLPLWACYLFLGLPKAAVISHERIWMASFLPLVSGVRSDDIVFIYLPLYHSAGFLMGLCGAIERGDWWHHKTTKHGFQTAFRVHQRLNQQVYDLKQQADWCLIACPICMSKS